MTEDFDWGNELPTLIAGRVELRWPTLEDAPALLQVFGDPEVMRYWSRAPFPDLETATQLVAEIHECFRTRKLFQWGIAARGEHELLGTCTLFHLDAANRRAEIGYALGRRSWGQGLAAEALGALIGFCFETLGLHRIEADIDPRNERSIRLVERQGFRREGTLRERYHVEGEIQDSAYFGLLAREWVRPVSRANAGG